MSEYWVSTPKYWCKPCSVYVRDTKLERTNHESTGRHQGALKRSLRDLHRNHEQEEREKERARREVERLNGIVSGAGAGGSGSSATASGPRSSTARGGYGPSGANQIVTTDQRHAQLEQLAQLGVEIPSEYRPDLALAGDWTVTSSKVVEDAADQGEDNKSNIERGSARGKGVRKREAEESEEQKEANEAITGLFKKRKAWGGAKSIPEADPELDALLNTGLVKKEPEETPSSAKTDGDSQATGSATEASQENPKIKPDPDGDEEKPTSATLDPKPETASTIPAVVFKKRKPKAAQQK